MTTYGSTEHVEKLVKDYGYSQTDAEFFSEWMKDVNAYLINLSDGLGIDDLPDVDFWAGWSDGEDSKDFARQMLEEEGFLFD